ncbi:Protein of unknown function [Bacillus cytotoxicus]|uniref:Uncharacterized protein n=1 Tax=Bacillus cytotoxicus TaxID=580165 RepID=A0AAX2CK52_9BACI|nr:Protein of unknown function [Bacillus cytotoxicus]
MIVIYYDELQFNDYDVHI